MSVSISQPPPSKTNEEQSSTHHKRWASLADRLNPNRPAFDGQLKASWKTLSKSERKRIIAEDKAAIHTLKSRGTISQQQLPFTADNDDHCETSPTAYTHIVPILHLLAKQLNKTPSELQIYDPYYCAGGMATHLHKLCFHNVYNKCEDFYNVIAMNKVPAHDVVLTNPPYSGDHFDKLLKFLRGNNKPALLLLPQHFSENKSALYSSDNYCFLTPPQRYHYWTPDGMRRRPEEEEKEKDCSNKSSKKKRKHTNLVLGTRNSPFASHWFIDMEPVMTNEALVNLVNNGVNKVQLVEGCQLYINEADIVPTNFKGEVQMKKKKKSRKRKKEGGGDPL